jgi:hypothetical protein
MIPPSLLDHVVQPHRHFFLCFLRIIPATQGEISDNRRASKSPLKIYRRLGLCLVETTDVAPTFVGSFLKLIVRRDFTIEVK